MVDCYMLRWVNNGSILQSGSRFVNGKTDTEMLGKIRKKIFMFDRCLAKAGEDGVIRPHGAFEVRILRMSDLSKVSQ